AEVLEAPAEELPFDDDSFDSVVATLVLCTVDDQRAALAEVARVLRPGGRLHLLEHVRAQTPGLARAQDLLHGPWFAIGHGCHCNRDTVAAIEGSPLELERLDRHEIPGMAPIVKPMVTGIARLD
ncbi:MAG TPA: class I SAM-dependent methyltransferase, partial [Solirubrobacterales bacterium]|nr:class I SAM-dependent methyltransferase [Solirubrobacterales bacterium]